MLADLRAFGIRAFTLGLGVCSVAWALYAFDVSRAEATIAGSARSIRAGEKYSAGYLDLLRSQLDTVAAGLSGPQAFADAAVIRLRLVETDSASAGDVRASDRAALAAALFAALRANPTDSFLWLVAYALGDRDLRASDRGQKMLRMSYLTGPNEGWIAVKRNPIAIAAYASLPGDMAEQVLSEFARMLHSEFYLEAADVVAASGPDLRKLLLARTAELDEVHRRNLARALVSKDVEGVTVPGIDNRPKRPF